MEEKMRCIFCKKDGSDSKSVEHIIPESLGNKSHILLKGIVCDSCNNYFAGKVEKEVLQLPYFKSLRGRNAIENKKGRIPGIPSFINNYAKTELDIFFTDNKIIEVIVENKELFNAIESNINRKLYIPILSEPPKDNIHISRFIGKIAIEALASSFYKVPGWQDEFIDNEGLDELRNFVRFGKGYKIWPYHIRKIYNEGQLNFDLETKKGYEILHEFDFLYPDKPIGNKDKVPINHLYFVMAIMGVEYAINMTNAGLDKYFQWLSINNGKSILKMDKSEFNQHHL